MKLKVGDLVKILKFKESILKIYPRYKEIEGKIFKVKIVYNACFEVWDENNGTYLIEQGEWEFATKKPLTYKEFMKKCLK